MDFAIFLSDVKLTQKWTFQRETFSKIKNIGIRQVEIFESNFNFEFGGANSDELKVSTPGGGEVNQEVNQDQSSEGNSVFVEHILEYLRPLDGLLDPVKFLAFFRNQSWSFTGMCRTRGWGFTDILAKSVDGSISVRPLWWVPVFSLSPPCRGAGDRGMFPLILRSRFCPLIFNLTGGHGIKPRPPSECRFSWFRMMFLFSLALWYEIMRIPHRAWALHLLLFSQSAPSFSPVSSAIYQSLPNPTRNITLPIHRLCSLLDSERIKI